MMHANGGDDPDHSHEGLPPGHRHPHGRPGQGEDPTAPPSIGIVGAGRVGLALGRAFAAAGWPVVAVASRDAGRRDAFRAAVPDARAFSEPAGVLDEASLIFLTVPDDAVAPLAADLRLYSGQALVHTSGAAALDRPRAGHGGRHARRPASTPWSPSRTRTRPSRRSMARPSPSRATSRWCACSASWPRRAARSRCACRSRARRPTMPPPSWRPVASWPCSTPSPSSAAVPASTRRGRWPSTPRSSARASPTPSASASRPP